MHVLDNDVVLVQPRRNPQQARDEHVVIRVSVTEPIKALLISRVIYDVDR
jgi:hypothetical protein